MSLCEDPRETSMNCIERICSARDIELPDCPLSNFDTVWLVQLEEALRCLDEDRPFAVTEIDSGVFLSRIHPEGEIVYDRDCVGWSGRGCSLEMLRMADGLDYIRYVNHRPGMRVDFLCFGEPMSPFQPQVVFTTEQVPSLAESLSVQYRSNDSDDFHPLILSLNFGVLTGHWESDSCGDNLWFNPATGLAIYEYDSDRERSATIVINSGEFYALTKENKSIPSVAVKLNIVDSGDHYIIDIYIRKRNKTKRQFQCDIYTITLEVPKILVKPDEFTPTPFADVLNPTKEEAEILDLMINDLWGNNIPLCSCELASY